MGRWAVSQKPKTAGIERKGQLNFRPVFSAFSQFLSLLPGKILVATDQTLNQTEKETSGLLLISFFLNKAFRDRNRKSQFFNHLSAVSEGTEALLWVGAVRTKFSLYFFNFQIFVFNEVISRGLPYESGGDARGNFRFIKRPIWAWPNLF